MKKSEKNMLLKHLKKDDKEFKGQLRDDMKLKKEILAKAKMKKPMSKEKMHEAKESKAYEMKEDKKEMKRKMK